MPGSWEAEVLGCREAEVLGSWEAEVPGSRGAGGFGKPGVQSNENRPHALRCPHCDQVLATDTDDPGVRLLG